MYVIMKDGLYICGQRDMGIREIDDSGERVPIMTYVWSANIRDAIPFPNSRLAKELQATAVYVDVIVEGGDTDAVAEGDR